MNQGVALDFRPLQSGKTKLFENGDVGNDFALPDRTAHNNRITVLHHQAGASEVAVVVTCSTLVSSLV